MRWTVIITNISRCCSESSHKCKPPQSHDAHTVSDTIAVVFGLESTSDMAFCT